MNCGGCNGCSLECLACEDPKYNMKKLGFEATNNVSEAEVFVVMGNINKKMEKKVKEQLKKFKGKKVAIGTCALSGNIFIKGGNVEKDADDIMKVDYYIPGCPPRPCAILNTLVEINENKKRK